MPRRFGARPLIAPSASLALASSILIALAALLPTGAAAKRSETSTASETAVVPAASAEPALTKAAVREAERQARRAERAAAAAEAQAAAAAAAAAGQAEHAAKRVEHAAEREARKTSAATGAAAPAGTRAAVKADVTHTEKQREHELAAEQRRREKAREHELAAEQRKHEREAKTGRSHETRKQREAREAREAAEAEEEKSGTLEKAVGGAGSGRQSIAAGGVSSIAGGSPTVQAASTTAVASLHTARAGHGVHGQSRRRPASGASAAGAGALALGAGAALAASAGSGSGEGGGAAGPSHASKGAHRASAGKAESTIVRTVTQIVGVIPTALWLLIGLLALAAAAFAVASRMSVRRARRLDSQRRALLEDVGLLQAALLPELPERLGPVGTSAAYRPASGPGAGGDFYDVFALGEGLLAVIVGDVSGHGRDALPHTTLLRYTLRAYMEAGLSPREALRAAAPSLERQLGGSFATVVLASWDPRARRLTYACAGHPHPIVTGLDQSASIIAASAPPIGAGRATGSRQTVMTIPGAGTAAFYTDGVIEARSAAGELYGSGRLASALQELRAEHAGARLEASELLDRVADETDRRPDDMAACLLELAGEEDDPRIVREELLLDARDAAGRRARRFLEAAGVAEPELGISLDRAHTIAAEHGSALLEIDLGGERPRVSVLQDNIAPLRARALARTQEVAL
jgi:serine phosphatase RsbU (regulator of sigma subunit)